MLIQHNPQRESAYLTQHTLLRENAIQVQLNDSWSLENCDCVCVRWITTPGKYKLPQGNSGLVHIQQPIVRGVKVRLLIESNNHKEQ